MLNFLRKLFDPSTTTAATPAIANSETSGKLVPQKTRAPGYSADVMAKHGFKLPASNVDKNLLGQEFEKAGQIEKAIACYEGCIQNDFDGTFPYDRLAIIYRRLARPADEERVLRRAVATYSTGAASGQGRSEEKLVKFQARLRKVIADQPIT